MYSRTRDKTGRLQEVSLRAREWARGRLCIWGGVQLEEADRDGECYEQRAAVVQQGRSHHGRGGGGGGGVCVLTLDFARWTKYQLVCTKVTWYPNTVPPSSLSAWVAGSRRQRHSKASTPDGVSRWCGMAPGRQETGTLRVPRTSGRTREWVIWRKCGRAEGGVAVLATDAKEPTERASEHEEEIGGEAVAWRVRANGAVHRDPCPVRGVPVAANPRPANVPWA